MGARKSRAKTGVVGGASTRPSLLLFYFLFCFVLFFFFFNPACSFVPSLGTESLEQARYLVVVKYITDSISSSYCQHLFVPFVTNIINDNAFHLSFQKLSSQSHDYLLFCF